VCGRYTLTQDQREFALKLALSYGTATFHPRFNICPSQQVPVILNTDPQKITNAKWGLIPEWAKDETIAHKLSNARADGVDVKPSFRSSFKKKRCLVLADGFFEWGKTPGQKGKTPYYFRLPSKEIFCIAGLWEKWNDILTCCLITTEANNVVGKIHDRMPVILEHRHYKMWLGEETPSEKLKGLLKPYAPIMQSFAVSDLVNNPRNDRPEVILPEGKGTCL
jgi:putative SOS response-associated peptidase YedK